MRKPNRVDWAECAGFRFGQQVQAEHLGTLPLCREPSACKAAYCRGKGHGYPLIAEEDLYEVP